MTHPHPARTAEPGPDLTSDQPSGDQHTIARSIMLHLLPGVAMLLAFVLGAPLVQRWGFPVIFTASLAILGVLVPLQLGGVLYQGWRRDGRLSLRGAMPYRQPMPAWQYLVFVPALIGWYLAVHGVWQPIQAALADRLAWLPPWLLDPLPSDSAQSHSAAAVLTTTVLRVLCTGIIAPVVEELYFRGYLLPRIERLGWRAAALNAGLFSLYHLWTPLLVPGRFLAWLPIVWVVRRQRSIYLGIVVHLALNLLGVIGPLIGGG